MSVHYFYCVMPQNLKLQHKTTLGLYRHKINEFTNIFAYMSLYLATVKANISFALSSYFIQLNSKGIYSGDYIFTR